MGYCKDRQTSSITEIRYGIAQSWCMNNKSTLSNSQTDWQRLDAMGYEDIDLSDCPEITSEMFAKTIVQQGLPIAKNKEKVLNWQPINMENLK